MQLWKQCALTFITTMVLSQLMHLGIWCTSLGHIKCGATTYSTRLVEWVITPYFMCYFAYRYYGSTNVEPWYHSTRRTFFYVARCQGHWGLTFFASILIRYHTYTCKDTQHTQGLIDLLPFKYISTPPVTCAQQFGVLHWMINSLVPKIYFAQFFNAFTFHKLLLCRGYIYVC